MCKCANWLYGKMKFYQIITISESWAHECFMKLVLTQAVWKWQPGVYRCIICDRYCVNERLWSISNMIDFQKKYWQEPLPFVSPKSFYFEKIPDSKVHGANMGPTWVLSAPWWTPWWPHEPCYQGYNETMFHLCNCHAVGDIVVYIKCMHYWAESQTYVLSLRLACCQQYSITIDWAIRRPTQYKHRELGNQKWIWAP